MVNTDADVWRRQIWFNHWLYDNKTFNNYWVDDKKTFNKWFGKRLHNGSLLMASGWQEKYGMMTSPWYHPDMTKNIDDAQISARYEKKYWLLNNDRTVTCSISKHSIFCYNSISFLLSRLLSLGSLLCSLVCTRY